jgi:predicted DNA-binding protein (UPF0278 family)
LMLDMGADDLTEMLMCLHCHADWKSLIVRLCYRFSDYIPPDCYYDILNVISKDICRETVNVNVKIFEVKLFE